MSIRESWRALFGFVACLGVALLAGREAHAAPSEVTTITTVGNPNAATIVAHRQRLYVTNGLTNTVSVIDTSTNTEVDIDGNSMNGTTRIIVGSNPQGGSVNRQTGRLFVANLGDDTASEIDTTSNTVVGSPFVGLNDPVAVEADPDTNRLYVINQGDSTVARFNAATHASAGSSISLSGFLSGSAFNPTLDHLLVSRPTANSVSVIDTSTWMEIQTITSLDSPQDVAVDLFRDRIYITNHTTDVLAVFEFNGTTYIEIDTDGNAGNGITRKMVVNGPGSVAYDRILDRIAVDGQIDSETTTVNAATFATDGVVSSSGTTGKLEFDPFHGSLYKPTAPSTVRVIFDAAIDGDDDNDFCADALEPSRTPPRDPTNPWDWMDVPIPSLPVSESSVHNGSITLGDVAATLAFVGTTDNGGSTLSGIDYDSDNNKNFIDDGAEYDRTPTGTVGVSGPPNGAVSLSDVGVVLAQVAPC